MGWTGKGCLLGMMGIWILFLLVFLFFWRSGASAALRLESIIPHIAYLGLEFE
jgi:hypothetical protein